MGKTFMNYMDFRLFHATGKGHLPSIPPFFSPIQSIPPSLPSPISLLEKSAKSKILFVSNGPPFRHEETSRLCPTTMTSKTLQCRGLEALQLWQTNCLSPSVHAPASTTPACSVCKEQHNAQWIDSTRKSSFTYSFSRTHSQIPSITV